MIKTKKQMFTIIGAFVLVMMLTAVTYAFFNYTRTGVANRIQVGRIYFSTTQEGTLNLTNVFPVSSSEVGNDYTQDTVKINITGDTTYDDGIEYLVTAENVNVRTSTGKKVPLTLNVTVTNDLGTEDTDDDQIEYFTDRGGNTSYYKLLSESVLYEGQYLLVGYIAKGATGIDGTINIKAHLDKDKVAISDTYPSGDITHTEASGETSVEVFDYTNGTTSTWVDGRVVLTTSEWNGLQNSNLSFKVKVEANEGTWVDPAIPINAAGSIPEELKENITEIYFIKETPIRLKARYDAATVKADMTDTTLNEGKVLGWQEGDKLYIASTGETYLPLDSTGYFYDLANVTKIEFENINTSRVENMTGLFNNDYGLTNLDLRNFDTRNVTNMNAMFTNSSSLENINLSSFDTSNVTNMNAVFNNCSSLKSINLDNFNFNRVTMMGAMFINCTSLVSIDLSGKGNNNLNYVSGMFHGCTNLQEVDMSNFNFGTSEINYLFEDLSNLKIVNLSNAHANLTGSTSISLMFHNCTNLQEIDMSGFDFGGALMVGLFSNLTNLETLNLTGANTSNVPNMSGLVYGCTKLEKVDLSGLGGNSLNNIGGMFNGCTNLREINMSGFNFGTANLRGHFSGNYTPNIEIIDLTNVNISNVTDTSKMFEDANHLKTVYVSNTWNTNSITDSSDMFSGCTSLVGGQGTSYDGNNPTDKTYAHIDGGQTNPGYFTLKTN